MESILVIARRRRNRTDELHGSMNDRRVFVRGLIDRKGMHTESSREAFPIRSASAPDAFRMIPTECEWTESSEAKRFASQQGASHPVRRGLHRRIAAAQQPARRCKHLTVPCTRAREPDAAVHRRTEDALLPRRDARTHLNAGMHHGHGPVGQGRGMTGTIPAWQCTRHRLPVEADRPDPPIVHSCRGRSASG